MILVDTGPIVAAALTRDRHHRACVDLFTAAHLSGDVLALPSPVVTDGDLTAAGRGRPGAVRADFVFYNQPASTDGSVRHTGKTVDGSTSSDGIDIALAALATDVHRVVIAVSADGGVFGGVEGLRVDATPAGTGPTFTFHPNSATETALLVGEIYRRSGGWRLRAMGQGYDDGLAGIARDFGVDIG